MQAVKLDITFTISIKGATEKSAYQDEPIKTIHKDCVLIFITKT